jgi:plasmid stability protein
MSAITIRSLPPETHRGLKARARRNGRSTEAEVRAILEEAVRPAERVKVGTLLKEFGRRYGPLEFVRDTTPTEPADFS